MMFESLSKLRKLGRRVDVNDGQLCRMEKLLGLRPIPPLGEIVVDGSRRLSARANLVARLDQHDERIGVIAKTIAARKR